MVVTAPRYPEFPAVDTFWDSIDFYEGSGAGGGGGSSGGGGQLCLDQELLVMVACELELGCEGDPNAYLDDCGRCVGGNTGSEPAKEGMDCDRICDYDDPFLNSMDIQAEIHRIWNTSYGSNSNPLPHDQRNEALKLVSLNANNEWEFHTGSIRDVSSCHI